MKKILLLINFLLLISCSDQIEVKADKNLSDLQIYQKAIEEIQKENYLRSIDYLKTLEERFPFSDLASQSQLLRMYVNYKAEDYDNVKIIAERFIKMNAFNPNIDFAYYMKALASFYQNDTFASKYLPIDNSLKDINNLKTAFNDFNTLLKLFPNSQFAEDSILRLNYIKNTIAKNEISIAQFYLERYNFVASLARANYIIENLQDTKIVPDALAIGATCAIKMNLNDMANDYLKVLKLNYPNHPSISKGTFQKIDIGFFNELDNKIINDNYNIDRSQSSKALNEKYQEIKRSLQRELDLKIN